jgi:hypothetical protein
VAACAGIASRCSTAIARHSATGGRILTARAIIAVVAAAAAIDRQFKRTKQSTD